MVLLFVFFILLCLYGIQIDKKQAFDSYLSRERTDSIKGLFILLIFFSHIKGYITYAGYVYTKTESLVFHQFFNFMGQLVVVMFLFYSGYGVMESIRKKGTTYIKAMPRHRILTTLLNFDVAVCVFLMVNMVLGLHFTLQKFLLSLIAWDDIGNSNWYIFAILLCYISTWISASNAKSVNAVVACTFITLIISIAILSYMKEPWWYNTLLAYPTGMFYSLRKRQMEAILDRNYILSVSALLFMFFAIRHLPFEAWGIRENFMSIVFTLLTILLSMRIMIGNRALLWCGKNLFPLYIYQRIPMIILATLTPWLISDIPWLYVTICFVITLLLVWLYKFIKIAL